MQTNGVPLLSSKALPFVCDRLRFDFAAELVGVHVQGRTGLHRQQFSSASSTVLPSFACCSHHSDTWEHELPVSIPLYKACTARLCDWHGQT